MPRKQKKYHFIYKTTNVVNGKYYVGMHSTNDLADEYIGSGKYLWNSIRKYGKENFKIEILEFLKTRKELIKREKNIVNEDFIKHPLCMNLKTGGRGGFVSMEACTKGAKIMLEIVWKDPEFIKRSKARGSKTFKRLHKEGKIKQCDWTGRKHKKETKNKIGKANSIHQKGEGNSQFGTCWIIKDGINKKIKKEELNKWILDGWILGRKIKYKPI